MMKKHICGLLTVFALIVAMFPANAAFATETDTTCTVTANLYVPGELNTQLPGVTAYVTNPNNPLGTVPDNLPEGMTVEAVAPTAPVRDNATVTVGTDGTLTLCVPLPNPVFTIQQIDNCSNAEILSAPRDSRLYSNGAGAERTGRITSITLKLNDRSGKYIFSDCVEFPTLLGLDWTVPLTLEVDLSDVPRSSGSGDADTDSSGSDGAAVSFSDVRDGAYYSAAVSWAVENNVAKGTSATTFSPDQACTRGQAVTFLWKASGSPEPESGKNPFTDISSDKYYYKAVLWAVEQGITGGTGATTFSPNQICNRGQIVTFLYRTTEKSGAAADVTFTDVDSSAFYYDAVCWAVENQITNGTSATTFSPGNPCTRGQVVTFLYKLFK